MSRPRLLLLTPPLLQTNTPYPATMHLTGFLASRGCDVHQRDLSIKVVRDVLLAYGDETTDELLEFLGGPAPLEAKREASEVIDELAIWIRDNVDPDFGFSRYAEHLCRAVDDFGELERKIRRRGVIDKPLERHLKAAMDEVRPTVVGVTCPFPGTLVGAFKIAKYVKRHYPGVRLLLGGGYVNTELREMTDRRPYRYFDEFLFDEGYGPLLEVCRGRGDGLGLALGLGLGEGQGRGLGLGEGLGLGQGRGLGEGLGQGQGLRSRADGNNSTVQPPTSNLQPEIPAFVEPSYAGIDWNEYFDVVETDNFVTNLWNSGKWLKLVMARGCYWHKCAFCDVVLPYIGCFRMPNPVDIVDAMVRLSQPSQPQPQPSTSTSISTSTCLPGFHFVDEAMPPALIKGVCEEIVRRKFRCEWWGNIRFDAAFTPALAKLMAKAGCIAVSGGLECANDRLLALMNKGITLASAEKALKAFKAAKIFVHAYLMYDFPTETKAEQRGAERFVKALAKKGLVQSCFWHRFALTVHSPIAREPEKFGIVVRESVRRGRRKAVFARNELDYERR